MKCPFCSKEMWHPIGKPTWSCQNWSCIESEGMIGNHVLWQALIDTKKKLDRYEKALEKIAKDRKIISMTGYSFDNEIYVNAAREALGLPFDIPEYDNVE